MKFKNKHTGVILTPNNEWAAEQLKKDNRFEIVGGPVIEPTLAKKEIMAILDEAGIEYDKKSKAADLMALLPEEEEK